MAFPPPRPPSQGTGGGVPGGRGSVSLLSTFNERCRALRTEPGLTPLPLGEPKPFVCHPGKTGVRRRAPQFRLCVPTSDALGLPPRPFRGQGLRWGRAGLGPAGRLCPTEAQRSRPLQPRAPGAGVGVGAALPCDPQRTVTLKTPIRPRRALPAVSPPRSASSQLRPQPGTHVVLCQAGGRCGDSAGH